MPRTRSKEEIEDGVDEATSAPFTKEDLLKILSEQQKMLETKMANYMVEIQEQLRSNIVLSPIPDNAIDVTPTHTDVEHTSTLPPSAGTPNTHRINVFNIEKLASDVSLHDFITWRTKWDGFCQLERLDSHPLTAQMAALRLVLSTQMLQTVTMVLNISPGANVSPKMVLDALHKHIREKRSIALDRVELEEFDDFYILLRKIADCADLCTHCIDPRLTTRIICGIQDQEARKKPLAASPFPTLQAAVNLCRSEESAARNEPLVSRSAASINKVYNKPCEQWKQRDERQYNNQNQAIGQPHLPTAEERPTFPTKRVQQKNRFATPAKNPPILQQCAAAESLQENLRKRQQNRKHQCSSLVDIPSVPTI